MNELKLLKDILARLPKRSRCHSSDWKLSPEYLPGERVMTLGCPDGKGAYVQFIFDDKGRTLEVKVIESASGDQCHCENCEPHTRLPCKHDYAPCECDAPPPYKAPKTRRKK